MEPSLEYNFKQSIKRENDIKIKAGVLRILQFI